MSTLERSITTATDRSDLYDLDIEKAKLALPNSEPSTLIKYSTSTKTGDIYVEQEELAKPDQSRSFLRRSSNIYLYITTRWRKYNEEKLLKKQVLEKLYSKLVIDPRSLDDYPPGWPQLAAFLHSEDNFAIFRRFGMLHCRLLAHLQAEIHLLEQQLLELDKEDYEAGPQRSWRLQKADINDHRAPCHAEQRTLLKKIREKVSEYDDLLLKDQKLRELGQVKKNDHLSVYHWICRKQPLGKDQYNWINHVYDFVPLSKTDQFEYSIVNSFFKRIFRSRRSPQNITHHYSTSHVSAFAKLISVLLAVAILIIPIFILLWIPETRAWISATVLISVFLFSALMSLFTEARVQEVLVGTAA